MTKHISRIALLVLVLISVGLMAWAVIVGMSAPESDKIAGTMPLVGQHDEDYVPLKDSLGNIVPVATVEDGIKAMGTATIHQMRHAESLNYVNTINEIKEVDATLVANEAVYNEDLALIAEIDTLKVNDPKAYKKSQKDLDKKYADAKASVEKYETEYAARLKADREWAKRIEGVKGSDFDKESKLVLEYMGDKLEGYKASLKAMQKELKDNAAEFEANKAIFDAACKVFAVEVKKKAVDPNNEETSDLVDDYVATIDSYKEQVKHFEDKVRAEKSKAEKDREFKKDMVAERNDSKATITDDVLASVQRYGELTVGIAETEFKISTTSTNIETIEKAVVLAKEEGDHLMALATAINWNIYWVYFLLVFAVVFVIAGFFLNLIHEPNWIKLGAVVVVVAGVAGVAYAIALGHGWDHNVLTMLDANGNPTDIAFGLGSLDSPDRVIFGEKEYMMADVSIWITYIAFILALVAAIFSWIWSWINSIIKK